MYKLIKPLGKSGKMQVTPSQSECLQKYLFKIGHEWATDDRKQPIYTHKSYLFWDEDMIITYSDCDIWFNNYFEENPLHKFEEHFKEE